MEALRAEDFYRLLLFCHRYRHAIFDRLSKADFQRWPEITHWKSYWFEVVAGRDTRQIPSLLVERELFAAFYKRVQYCNVNPEEIWSDIFDLSELTRQSAIWSERLVDAVANVGTSTLC